MTTRAHLDLQTAAATEGQPCLTLIDHTLTIQWFFDICINKICVKVESMNRFLSKMQALGNRFDAWAVICIEESPRAIPMEYRLRYNPELVEKIHRGLESLCKLLISFEEVCELSAVRGLPGDEKAEENIEKEMKHLEELKHEVMTSYCDSMTIEIIEFPEETEAIDKVRLRTRWYIGLNIPDALDSLHSPLIVANEWRARRLLYQRLQQECISKVSSCSFQRVLDDLKKAAASLKAPMLSAKMKDFHPKVDDDASYEQRQWKAKDCDLSDELTKTLNIMGLDISRKFPQLPDISPCPYCGVKNFDPKREHEANWDDHVINDLEPLTCIIAGCEPSRKSTYSPQTFRTYQSWMAHIEDVHAKTVWICSDPSHDALSFAQSDRYQTHMREEHNTPVEQLEEKTAKAKASDLDRVLETMVLQFPASKDMSLELRLHHIARHMMNIALLALPSLPGSL